MGKTRRITQVEYIITLGDGLDYKVKSLSLVDAKEAMSKLTGLDDVDKDTDIEKVPGLMDNLIDICAVILKATNSKLTNEKVAEIVSVTDIKTIMNIGLGNPVDNETEEVK